LSLSYWASVIQRGAAHIQRPLDLRYLEWTAIAILWCFYLALDMCLFLTKGFFKSFMTYLQLLISAGLLALIGFSFLVYGMRVRSRLRHFERQRMIFELRNNTYQPADTSRSDYDPNETRLEDGRIDMDGKYGPRRSRTNTQGAGKSHANKILKIVAVVEVFVVLVVAAQVGRSVVDSDFAKVMKLTLKIELPALTDLHDRGAVVQVVGARLRQRRRLRRHQVECQHAALVPGALLCRVQWTHGTGG